MPTQCAFTQLAGMPGSSINAVVPHLSTVETITATDSFPLQADNVHYTGAGQVSLGTAFYNAVTW